MELTRYERETIINFNDEEKHAEIYTCSPKIMKKLDKLAEEFPDAYKLKSWDDCSKTYMVTNKKYISFRKPKRNLTESHRRKLSENLLKYHQSKDHNVKSDF